MEFFLKGCKALGDSRRLEIFKLLLDHSYCVNAIARQLGISQSAVSQHMRVLREAGLVAGEKRGYHVHYSVRQDGLETFRAQLETLVEQGSAAPACCANHHVPEDEDARPARAEPVRRGQ